MRKFIDNEEEREKQKTREQLKKLTEIFQSVIRELDLKTVIKGYVHFMNKKLHTLP
jgi:hypothetical protein